MRRPSSDHAGRQPNYRRLTLPHLLLVRLGLAFASLPRDFEHSHVSDGGMLYSGDGHSVDVSKKSLRLSQPILREASPVGP